MSTLFAGAPWPASWRVAGPQEIGLGVILGFIGLYKVYIGMMEEKMETTILGLGYKSRRDML